MQIQCIPYIWPLVVSAFISLSLGIYVILKRRNSKGALSFILSMFVQKNNMDCGYSDNHFDSCVDRWAARIDEI
jgi:hypothetical protein